MGKRFNFAAILSKFERAQRDLPREIARIVVNHSNESFRKGGFTDTTFSPWAPRKRGNKADRATGRSRALLIDSGNMRRSIRASRVTFSEIRVGAYGINYATYHNQGVVGRLPQRKFLGKSATMRNLIRERIRRTIKNTFK